MGNGLLSSQSCAYLCLYYTYFSAVCVLTPVKL